MQSSNYISQACIRAITHLGIAFVTDLAAYCKKTYQEILPNVIVNSYHVSCFTYILNLVEVFSQWPEFDNVSQLTTFIKSSFFKKLSCKQRYLRLLA